MNLRRLNRILADAGVDPFRYGPDPRRWQTLSPTSITTEGDRGEQTVEEFPDEDALCRHLLVRELAGLPPRRGARLRSPDAPVRAVEAGAGLAVRWSRPAGPFSGVLARGHGLVAVLDTGGLVEDPAHGGAQVTVVDVGTGEALSSTWSAGGRAGHALVGGQDPLLVTVEGARVEAVGANDGVRRWACNLAGPMEIEAETHGVVVLRDGHGVGIGVDVADGSQRWRVEGLASTRYVARGLPTLDRFFAVGQDGSRVVVRRIDLATGAGTTIADAPLDPDLRGASFLVVVDGMDDVAGRGHLVVRTRMDRLGDGSMTDLVVTPGEVERSSVAEGESFLGESFAPDRLLRQARYPHSTATRLETLDGRALWSCEGAVLLRGRVGEVTVLDRSAPRGGGRQVDGVADDGVVRWTETGTTWEVDGDEVWIHQGDGVVVVGARDGRVRRRVDAPWPTGTSLSTPNRRVGWHPDDQHVLFRQDDVLRAAGWS